MRKRSKYQELLGVVVGAACQHHPPKRAEAEMPGARDEEHSGPSRARGAGAQDGTPQGRAA